jgi:excisionase family DNA binding protein
MELSPKILFTRKEAAELLSLSVSSLDMMIARGMLKITRKGRRVLIYRTEIERVARQDVPRIWPSKIDGKTNRAVA